MARQKKGIEYVKAKRRFLDALEATGNITESARLAKIKRKTVYNWRTADANFRKAWDAAEELGVDSLEDEAVRRGREGTLKPVFQGGKEVGLIREFSNTLLIFMLKAKRPAKYRENSRVELAGGDPIKVEVEGLTDVELAARIAGLESALRDTAARGTPAAGEG
jgi:hypothetical protein